MDFDFSPEQQTFAEEVERFLDENDDPDVFDLTRENMAQIVDTPKRRAFMAKMGSRGFLGMTWPKQYGGSEGEGVYEYLLNEQLAGRGGPQIGKGVGIIGKTLIAHGNDFLKEKFLPMILRNEVEFAVGYSEPNAGSDAASMRLKAERAERDGTTGWVLNGQKTWTTSAHFAEWYWLGTRTDPDDKHRGITLMLVPLDQPGVEIRAIWTMGDERTNEVFIDNVFVPDEFVVGQVNSGFQYISQALDLERFTMFTFSPSAVTGCCSRTIRWCGPSWPGSTPTPRWPGSWVSRWWPSRSRASTRRRRPGDRPSRRPSSRPSTSCSPPSSRGGWPTPR